MKIAVLSETSPGRAPRCGLARTRSRPMSKKAPALRCSQAQALGRIISDEAFKAAGASIVKCEAVVKDADIVLTVRRPSDASSQKHEEGRDRGCGA